MPARFHVNQYTRDGMLHRRSPGKEQWKRRVNQAVRYKPCAFCGRSVSVGATTSFTHMVPINGVLIIITTCSCTCFENWKNAKANRAMAQR